MPMNLRDDECEKAHRYVKYLIVALLLSCALLMLGCYALIGRDYPQDNFFEELIEEGIKIETGIDLDLSPETAEA